MGRPQSATHALVASAGFAAFLVAAVVVRYYRPFGNDLVPSAMLIIALPTVAIFLVDLGWQKVYRRPSTGLDFEHDDPSWPRTLTKVVGLFGSLGFVALGYWLFPEYHNDSFANYYALLRLILLPWLALAVPYFFWVDRHMADPRDGYWHLGRLLTMRWAGVDRRAVAQQLLGWVIKGFFMPLMFTYMCGDLKTLLLFNFDTLTSFQPFYEFLYRFLFFIDVGLAATGYLMSFRLTDTHLRSAEPTMLGWLVTIVCYEPLWPVLLREYVPYDTGYPWGAWLGNKPFLFGIWGCGILVFVAIYAWATVIFGARFSNLTHRGVITNGPYRWTKHPAYLAKNISWWMVSVPFMPRGTPDEAIRRCLLLLAVNFLYVMRAKTEEWHMSRDPGYVQYALWMEEHGPLRFLRRLPLLRRLAYQQPARRGGS